jgi:uncharacterized protein (DUF169 family)
MDTIHWLERVIGGRWIGVKFHRAPTFSEKLAGRPMRFCTALAEARIRPVVLTPTLTDCPGAKRSFGWATEDDDAMAGRMAEKLNVTEEVALNAIKCTPKLRDPVVAITIGGDAPPDVAMSCMQPASAMKLVARRQQLCGGPPILICSSVMAVCGGVAVRAHLTDALALSFGCPDSRAEAGIGRDQLVVGVPALLIRRFRQQAPTRAASETDA